MATIRVGSIIESDFGQGPVVAITRAFVIHQTADGSEIVLSRDDDEYSIPVTEHEIGGGQAMTIEHPDT